MASKCKKCGNKDNYNFALNIGLCNSCIASEYDQLQAENADLKKEIVKLKTQMLPNEYESLTTEAIDEKQALDG